MRCCDILAGKKLWEINYCDISKLSVLQARNLEKVQLVPFSFANSRKSHATHQKRELLIPFCNFILYLLSKVGSSCHDILFSKQRNCKFVYFSHYSWKRFHGHILCAPYTYIHINTFSEFNNLLFVIDMRNMTNIHTNTIVYFLFLPSLLKQHGFMCA